MMALHASAQITPLIEESFKNIFTVPEEQSWIELDNSISSYPDWTFNNCYAVQYDDDKDGFEDVWLQIGSREETGYLVTSSLSGLSGNARIMAQAYGRDDDTRVCIGRPGSKGELGQQNLIAKETWIRLNPVLLQDNSESSRVQFFLPTFRFATWETASITRRLTVIPLRVVMMVILLLLLIRR